MVDTPSSMFLLKLNDSFAIELTKVDIRSSVSISPTTRFGGKKALSLLGPKEADPNGII